MERNARFWIWWNGWTKLTLKPEETISFGRSEPTDEGWSSNHEQISLSEGDVIRECSSDGVDCDGRLSQYSVVTCKVEDLQKVKFTDRDTGQELDLPDWQKEESGQRDYRAEAMGY